MKCIAVILPFIVAATLNTSAGVRVIKPVNPPTPVVNINTATPTQLVYLPGIGPALAQRIVAGRPYARIDGDESLELVRGIGGGKLDALRPYVVLTGPTTAVRKIHGGSK